MSTDNGQAFSWGYGEDGALGLGTTESQWVPVGVSLEGGDAVGVKAVSCGSRHTGFISGRTTSF